MMRCFLVRKDTIECSLLQPFSIHIKERLCENTTRRWPSAIQEEYQNLTMLGSDFQPPEL